MKIFTYLAVGLLCLAILSSCKKEDGASPEDIAKANQFKSFVVSKQFQISEYYSNIPIDYEEDDEEVKSETDLWPYVSLWIKDDLNVFDVSTGKVTVTQGEDKIAGNDAETIVKDFSIGADKDGVYFNFLSHEYNPLKYRLVEFTSEYFIIYLDWHSGSKVHTKFAVIP